VTKEQLKDMIHNFSLSRLDILIILLSVDSNSPKQVETIKKLGVFGGLRKITTWNISDILARSKGLAVRSPSGWELCKLGKERAMALGVDSSPIVAVKSQLRDILRSINNPQTHDFLDEAIKCLEAKYLRAAVVLTWVGAVSLLYDYVLKNRLLDFNNEASRRNAKWKIANNKDDLGNMKEYDFLQILGSISVIGKNVKEELESCLKLRNSCGHPSSLKIGENRVASHIEVLMLNIFSKF